MTAASDESRQAVERRLDDVAVVRAIGKTPLLRLRTLERHHGLAPEVELWLKAEWVNPGGSVKDRPALFIVRDALERGLLDNGKTLLDSTSGNTGIAYAMLGAAIGFPVQLVLPGSASEERKQILAAYGAVLIESDPYDGSNGAIKLVRQIVAAEPERYFFADQYGNPANPRSHYETTGPELWRQTGGRITHFVAGLGTTGTMMGTGQLLREKSAAVQLVAVEPADSFHGIEGLKHMPTAIVPAIYDERFPDRHLAIDTQESFEAARRLARLEGIFAGTSTGAAIEGAIRIAVEATGRGEAAVIVALAPDDGSKYLSTGLWNRD